MDVQKRQQIFDQAKEWILEAGTLIRSQMNNPLIVNTKSNRNDLVTQLDKEVELFFTTKIKQKYPNHSILSEEGFGHSLINKTGITWIIDPIDGTMNLVHQRRNFAISIGIYDQEIGEIGFIYDVMCNQLYSAQKNKGAYKNDQQISWLDNELLLEHAMICFNHRWLCENKLVNEKIMQQLVKQVRGVRAYGSAALEFAYVAEGIVDAYITMHLEPWDFAAGKIIVQEVGGKITSISGEEINPFTGTSLLVCHPQIHQKIIDEYLLQAKK